MTYPGVYFLPASQPIVNGQNVSAPQCHPGPWVLPHASSSQSETCLYLSPSEQKGEASLQFMFNCQEAAI